MSQSRPQAWVEHLAGGGRRVVIKVPAVPPSLNDWSRAHWRERYRLTGGWVALLRSATVGIGMVVGSARVTVVYSFKNRRRRDLDNLVPKFIMDGLKGRVVADDDERYVGELVLRMENGAAEEQTTIVIEPLQRTGTAGRQEA